MFDTVISLGASTINILLWPFLVSGMVDVAIRMERVNVYYL